MWVWGGCCCDFDFVGVLYGVILFIICHSPKSVEPYLCVFDVYYITVF